MEKERLVVQLAKSSENLYAGNMPDERINEPRLRVAGSDKEQARRAQTQEKEKKVSEDPQIDEEAKQATEEFVKEEIQTEKELGLGARVRQERKKEVKVSAKHFPPDVPLPQNPRVLDAVEDFYQAAGDKALSDLPRKTLVKHYLKIRRASGEEGAGTGFLKKFEAELRSQKVNVDNLVEEANQKLADRRSEATLLDPFSRQAVSINSIEELKSFVDQIKEKINQGGKNPFGELSTEELKQQYRVFRRIESDLTSQGNGQLRNMVTDYGRGYIQPLLEELIYRNQEDARSLFLEEPSSKTEGSLGADRLTINPGWTSPELTNEMDGVNAVLDTIPDRSFEEQLEELQNASRSVGRLGGVPPAEKTEALAEISRRINEIRNAPNYQNQQEQRRGLQDREKQKVAELESMSVTVDEVDNYRSREGIAGLDPGIYTNTNLQRIANQVRGAAESEVATNTFLRERLDEVSEIRRQAVAETTDQARRTEEEAGRLWRSIKDVKEILEARMRSELQSSVQMWSSQGETRMTVEDKNRLVSLALDATNPLLSPEQRQDAELQLENDYNKLFSAADAKSADEWRDALGSARSIEIQEFDTTLINARTGRIAHKIRRDPITGRLLDTPIERTLTQEERDRLENLERKLSAGVKLRETLHGVYFYVNQAASAEELRKSIRFFKAEAADRAYQIKGVSTAAHFYEQAMYQVMARHGGYLPYEAMVNKIDGTLGEVEQIVWDEIKRARDMGVGPLKDMEQWELGRAVGMARGMGVVSGRWFEIIAQAGIPKGRPLDSWWANNIIKNMAFFRQIARYDVGKERNRFLAFKLENQGKAWSTKELSEITSLGSMEILDRFINEDARPDRYIDMINPFRIGSVYTQTGWRWGPDDINRAGAIAHILDWDPKSPIIGLGMWVEKLRGDYSGHDKDKSDKAKEQLETQIKHALDITPLKFFYNLNGLRQKVLRGDDVPSHKNSQLVAMYGDDFIQEGAYNHETGEYEIKDENRGQLIIKSILLKKDLSAFSILQEQLLQKRVKAYADYLRARDRHEDYKQREVAGELRPGEEEPSKPVVPNLLSGELATFDLDSLVTASDPGERAWQQAQVSRVRALAGIIKTEFMKGKSPGTSQTHYERLMFNLKNKGWKIPFVFGTEDIPHEIYHYGATADNSFDRRWGDIDSAAKAAGAYEQMIRHMADFKSQDDIIKALTEVYNNLVGHDEDVTREVMLRTVEGITKFYKKDYVTRLPFGIGTMQGALKGQASYAQIAFGRDKMAWDELDVDTFMRKVEDAGLIKMDEMEGLRKRTGAEALNLMWAIGRTAIPLFILAFIYFMFQEQMKTIAKGN